MRSQTITVFGQWCGCKLLRKEMLTSLHLLWRRSAGGPVKSKRGQSDGNRRRDLSSK